MGWLHKTKHEDGSNSTEKKIENSDSIQNKINVQQEHLDSISKKLEVVKGEYGEVISSLMSAKKELAEKRKEISLLILPFQNVQDILKKSKKGDSLEFKKQLDMKDNDEFSKIITFYKEKGIKSKINAVVKMHVETISEVTSPLYDLGFSEEEIKEKWKKHYLSL